MKLLIVGSRSIKYFDLTPYIPAGTGLIISGGADGIDTVAEKFADKMRKSKLIIRPDYALYGRSAPLKRNEVMVNLADQVLVIWDGKSRGTKYTIDYAKKIGKAIIIVEVDKCLS